MTGLMIAAVPQRRPLQTGEDGLWEELGDVRVEKPAMGTRELYLANELSWLINSFARPRELGLAFTEMLFEFIDLPQARKRRPDVAFVARARVGQPVLSEDEAWEVTPDLAVEIVSPSNSATDIEAKIREYLDAGVTAVWVIYPETQTLYVHAADGVQCIRSSGAVDGGEILPGFRFVVADLFHGLKPIPIPTVSDE